MNALILQLYLTLLPMATDPGAAPEVISSQVLAHEVTAASDAIRAVAEREGTLLLADAFHHRLVVWRNGRSEWFGEIGNGPGELFYPAALAVTPAGEIWVHDAGNHRLQEFTSPAHPGRVIPLDREPFGLAAGVEKLYVGDPSAGRLVAVLDMNGRRTEWLGETFAPGDFGYPERDGFDLYRLALNRVQLATDETGNLWVAFLHLPRIQQYGPDGRLLIDRHLDLPGLDRLAQAVWNREREPAKATSLNIDGIQLTVVLKSLAYSAAMDVVVILLGDDRLLVLSPDAEPLCIIQPQGFSSPLAAVATLEDEAVLAAFGASTIYRVSLGSLLRELEK